MAGRVRDITAFAGLAVLCAGLLAGCDKADQPSAPEPSESAAAPAQDTVPAKDAAPAQDGADAGQDQKPATFVPELDFTALSKNSDPERLLTFYARAIEAGRWETAASAWSSDAHMTAARLAASYGNKPGMKLVVGAGDTEGAAGTLHYDAPVTAYNPKHEAVKSGDIILRRVNDVPGASDEQLSWRIERSSLVTQK